jgi:DDE superfamily endonuclease.
MRNYLWCGYTIFVCSMIPKPENPVLLMLDNHNSHVSLLYYKFCRENSIVMIYAQPNLSHRLQPSDVIFCGPPTSAFHRECDLFLKTRSMKMSPFDVTSVFNKAYSQVASVEKGISGFKVTGIYLLNPHTFSVEDFVVLQRSQIILTSNWRH